jgi:hypothetical protein
MQFYIDNYSANLSPSHHDDANYTDEGQKEVYEFCRNFMKENNLKKVIDVGCGSGYKLVKYLSDDFETLGIETEPCYSLLLKKYPQNNWSLSGEAEKSFDYSTVKDSDVVLCCDVIEHIVNPDDLIKYLLSFTCKYYIISTPCREILCKHPKFSSFYGRSWNGPPRNSCHVREWTMNEFKLYLSNTFNIKSSFYCKDQIECQFHLLEKLN